MASSTYFLKLGLEEVEADKDGDGFVRADELVDYVRRQVYDYTGGKQTPVENQAFDSRFVLARNAGTSPDRSNSGQRTFSPTRKDTGKGPNTTGTLVVVSKLDGVQFYLDMVPMGDRYEERQRPFRCAKPFCRVPAS